MKSPFNINEHNSTYTTARPVTADELISTARDLIAARLTRGTALSNPDDSRDYLITQLAGYEHEVFCCLFLDQRHRIIDFRRLFRGTIDSCPVHPREVVKMALFLNAAAVSLATTTRLAWLSPAGRIRYSHGACRTPWPWWRSGCWTTSSWGARRR